MSIYDVQRTGYNANTYAPTVTYRGSTQPINKSDIFTQERQLRGNYETVVPDTPAFPQTPERPITQPEDYNEAPSIGLEDVKNAQPTEQKPLEPSIPQEGKTDWIAGNDSGLYGGENFDPNRRDYYTVPEGNGVPSLNSNGTVSQGGATYVQDAGGEWNRVYSFLQVTW